MKLNKLMNDFLQDYLDQNKVEFSDWSINVNNQEGFGDYSSNIALKLAKILKKAPIEIAEKIAIHPNVSENVFIIANEILDAIPSKIFHKEDNKFYEKCIIEEEGNLVIILQSS